LGLPRLPKGDKSKEALSRQLRQETTISLKWITQRLSLGSWSNVVNLLRKSKSAKSKDCILILIWTWRIKTRDRDPLLLWETIVT